MTEELDILKIVEQDPSVSQRKIAEQTGISLGQVNYLLKKFVKKGLIKIEGQTPRSLRYNLTPAGIAEKSVLVLNYIKLSYARVAALSVKVKDLQEECKSKGMPLYVYGPEDEVAEICKIALGPGGFVLSAGADLVRLPGEKAVILYWREEDRRDDHNLWVNILN